MIDESEKRRFREVALAEIEAKIDQSIDLALGEVNLHQIFDGFPVPVKIDDEQLIRLVVGKVLKSLSGEALVTIAAGIETRRVFITRQH